MISEPIVMVCCPDISGHTRGKSIPLANLESRMQRGVGWLPTNIQITVFNAIAGEPFGSFGDLLLVPDPAAEVQVDFGDDLPAEHFFLANVLHTDGTPWACCLRNTLRKALADLGTTTGLQVLSAFEMEFQYLDDTAGYGPAFSLAGLRKKKRFGEVYLAALRQAGVASDTFIREWGPSQYEVTMQPALGATSADHALILRELARATAHRLDDPITFTPLRDPGGVGNGVHVHLSLLDGDGTPVTYDADRPHGLSDIAGHFVAGILDHLTDIVALTAPSVISYKRLTPHRWSAAFTNLGYRDREATCRICPIAELEGMDPSKQYNFEYRAADSTASPHLQLAALVFAGLDGITRELPPPTPTTEDLSLLSASELQQRGFRRLPESLPEALQHLEASDAVRSWFGDLFVEVYVNHKRAELAYLDGRDPEDVYRAYEQVY